MRAQMEQVLQNPQQCAELMQLCIARTKVLTLFPAELRLRITPVPPMEEEVETRSDHSTGSGLPLQWRVPTDAVVSSVDLVQWPAPHLFGLIRASTTSWSRGSRRPRDPPRSQEKNNSWSTHTKCRKHMINSKSSANWKKCRQKLVEAWPEIRKVAPELPEGQRCKRARETDRVVTGSMDTTRQSH
jgi:hypothetical protein